ncbi:unnamed protein product [Arabis nemorensis]|uniref:Uncharacterized protein n=1 Tax=Arabis nemorensis TaxID=586526 RepID=A0A565CD46_9BRAS|nr:unnamed protein product [Arabis nemorensis]
MFFGDNFSAMRPLPPSVLDGPAIRSRSVVFNEAFTMDLRSGEERERASARREKVNADKMRSCHASQKDRGGALARRSDARSAV